MSKIREYEIKEQVLMASVIEQIVCIHYIRYYIKTNKIVIAVIVFERSFDIKN